MTGTPIEIIRFLSEQEQDKLFDCDAHKEKRSLNANSYFHKLVGEMARLLKCPDTEVKNRLIRDYGTWEYVDGHIPTYLVDREYVDDFLNRPEIHFCHIGYDEATGRAKLAVKRGSHTYNTLEMAKLIDGTVEEAKQMGIETETPEKLREMKERWGI